jgi:hypothetical protein
MDPWANSPGVTAHGRNRGSDAVFEEFPKADAGLEGVKIVVNMRFQFRFS